MQMAPGTTDTLRVLGARLYYQVRGTGPLLLLIAGGAGDAESFDGVAAYLVQHYTVVTYDRRGFARSPLDDPEEAIAIATHSADVHQLLASLTTLPAFVFASSIGALIGLDLAIRHSEQVRALVAHEPPLPHLLPEAERPAVDMHEIAGREGTTAAIQQFAASIGVPHAAQEPEGAPPEEQARHAANRASFLQHDLSAVGRYRLDIDALRTAPTRIVIVGGEAGRAYFPYLCASRLAERLGTPLAEFPGHHAGYGSQPRAFAARLREVLGA
jgi:pimeloyl-ACP methyl ester carboxylesterase